MLCAARVLLRLDEFVGIAVTLILLTASFTFCNIKIVGNWLVLFAFFYTIGVFYFLALTPTLAGPDEINYYDSLLLIDDISLYLKKEISYFMTTDLLALRDSRITFPLIYVPIFGFLNVELPEAIAIINVAFYFLAILIFIQLLNNYSPARISKKTCMLAGMLMLLSPSAMYWSSVFSKDIISMSLCMLGAYFVIKRSYLFACLLIIMATALRPYAIAITGIYVLFLHKRMIYLLVSAAMGLALVLLVTHSVKVLMNVPIVSGYILLSPNPLNENNFSLSLVDTGTWVFAPLPLTLEGLFLGGVLVLGLVEIIRTGRIGEWHARCALAIFVYAGVLVLVGHRNIHLQGFDYELGMAGDNIVRKKLAMLPILAVWAGYTLSRIKLWYLRSHTTGIALKGLHPYVPNESHICSR